MQENPGRCWICGNDSTWDYENIPCGKDCCVESRRDYFSFCEIHNVIHKDTDDLIIFFSHVWRVSDSNYAAYALRGNTIQQVLVSMNNIHPLLYFAAIEEFRKVSN